MPQQVTRGSLPDFGFVEFPDERGQDMGGLRIVVVVRPVQVRGHGADEVAAVLPAVGLAHLDAGDLGDGIPLVGGFQRAGEEVFLLQRLGGELGINAGAAEEEQFLHAGLPGAVDEVVLDLEVFVEELGWLAAVGQDAADFGGGHEDELRLCLGVKVRHCGAVQQVEFLPGSADEMAVALPLQFAPDGAADQAAMAGDIDCRVKIHASGRDRAAQQQRLGQGSAAGQACLRSFWP